MRKKKDNRAITLRAEADFIKGLAMKKIETHLAENHIILNEFAKDCLNSFNFTPTTEIRFYSDAALKICDTQGIFHSELRIKEGGDATCICCIGWG